MKKKIYTVAIIIGEYPSSMKANDSNKYYGLIPDIWNHIKRKLDKKYVFKEYFTKTNDYTKIIEACAKDKYNILIGSLGISYEIYQKVNYTKPLFVITPDLYYSPQHTEIDYRNYIKYFISIIIKIYLFLFIFSLILGYLFTFINNKRLNLNIYQISAGFFGQSSGIVTKTYNKSIFVLFFSILILIIILLSHLYLSAKATSSSVKYLNDSSAINYSIKDKKILVEKGNGEYIKKKGGIPIILPKDTKQYIADYYLSNPTIADGFMDAGRTETFIRLNPKKYSTLKKSEYKIGYSNQHFIVNKKYTEILEEMNDIISEMQFDDNKNISVMEIICSRYTNEYYLCNI